MYPCRLCLTDYLNLSQNPENKVEVNSKEIQVSENNERYVSADMDTDEFDGASLQIAPDNSNAEPPDESLLDNTILSKVKYRVVFTREDRNEWERRTIYSRASKQMSQHKD